MNTTSWHSVSPHPFGPEEFPAAVVEEYRPVAWVGDAETAEFIATVGRIAVLERREERRRRRAERLLREARIARILADQSGGGVSGNL